MSSDPSIRPDTRLSLPLKVAALAAGALVSAGAAGAKTYFTMTARLGGIESRVGDLVTKTDLNDLERRVSTGVRRQLGGALVRCPRSAARGDAWMKCEVVFIETTGER